MNMAINETLLKTALAVGGFRSKRETVEEGLRLLIKYKQKVKTVKAAKQNDGDHNDLIQRLHKRESRRSKQYVTLEEAMQKACL